MPAFEKQYLKTKLKYIFFRIGIWKEMILNPEQQITWVGHIQHSYVSSKCEIQGAESFLRSCRTLS